MKVGNKIKQLRDLRNYTQMYMSKSLQMSLNGYGRLERDEIQITIHRLQDIAKILNIDLLQLLAFDENKIFDRQLSQDSDLQNALIAHLQDENKLLRNQNNRLLTLLENKIIKHE